MLFTLIVCAVAGAAAPLVEPWVAGQLRARMKEDVEPARESVAVLSFAFMLFSAALLLAVAGAEPSPILVVLGGLAGHFHRELLDAGQRLRG